MTFQSIMDHIFRDLINTGKVSVYIDNIVIHTKTLEEHRRITKEVLEILQANKLYIKPEKCEIEKEKIEYLGVVVSEGKVEMDPVKNEALTSWPTPKKLKELQSFLGFCDFYRWFIKDYSKIAKPLNQLTGKEEWKWGAKQQAAFDTLQKVIMVICLGRNKDLCSRRSKYKSYGALRGCDLGVRDCLQVYCGK